ncbi:archaetidylserine decarboxylase [Acidisphaera sp. L21]|jgi:phosphatidylserine decarboxylase|uniref:archaetidylserine decarboxylase n=1 Tax=Acidisphaera sp. L21 TaxID=1641851 RepID=UPI001C203302|nr:archaetidylserine decarboxylase [Acidisphaera sp. L21]
MKIVQQDGLNFLLTNGLPRRRLTSLIGWFSKIENPLVCAVSLGVWRMFTDLDLSDAQQTRYASMHQCFTRRLKPGARPVDADPAILASPCDAIIGACGTVRAGEVLQIKGMPYSLQDLFGDAAHAAAVEGGQFVTLRLTSAMYHRFHAPYNCQVSAVTHIFGDVWNVNPVTLRRVARLFCKNERALIRTAMAGHDVTLVTVAAVLVAGIRLSFLDLPLEHRHLPRRAYACDATLQKGDEMGWFEHGSTILVFAPAGFSLCESLREGAMIRAGQRLMQLPG